MDFAGSPPPSVTSGRPAEIADTDTDELLKALSAWAGDSPRRAAARQVIIDHLSQLTQAELYPFPTAPELTTESASAAPEPVAETPASSVAASDAAAVLAARWTPAPAVERVGPAATSGSPWIVGAAQAPAESVPTTGSAPTSVPAREPEPEPAAAVDPSVMSQWLPAAPESMREPSPEPEPPASPWLAASVPQPPVSQPPEARPLQTPPPRPVLPPVAEPIRTTSIPPPPPRRLSETAAPPHGPEGQDEEPPQGPFPRRRLLWRR